MAGRTTRGVLIAAVLAGTLLLPGVAISAPLIAGIGAGPNAGVTSYSSENWAGYFASGPNGSVTKVSSSWEQPTASCGSGTSYSVFWVGIDGATDTTVEQIGTIIGCSKGVASYAAWWELYPTNSIQIIKKLTVNPGDSVSASVTYASGSFTMAITVAGHSFSKTGAQSALQNSAECIAERPAHVVDGNIVFYHLAKFSPISFVSCTATISGHARGIGAFSSVGEVTMEDTAGHVLAATSGLNGSKNSFSVTWKRSS
ncbi:MAG TPA: G1 family glutamic endopeptidase [Thermoplasmata archaeon]|nr:G1 family glutamic endopeptidase [Thermoplasmata archaeon]